MPESKVSDVFDSVKFAANANAPKVLRLHKIHAKAALYETLLFSEKGLILTAPQFFDGIAGSDSEWRKKIFYLLKNGHIKIGLYNVPNAPKPLENMRDYLCRHVAKLSKPLDERKMFCYSSKPNIAELYQNNDSSLKEFDDKVWRHILCGENKPILGREKFALEYMDLIDFFDEFFRDIDTSNINIYDIQNSMFISYNDFFNRTLSDFDKQEKASLFNVGSRSNSEEIIQALIDERSVVDDFLKKNIFELDDTTIEQIRIVTNLLYNKYSLLNFQNVEIHVPYFENDEYMRNALKKIATASNIINLGHYDYENTEIICKEHSLNALSFDEVVGMRNEIIELKEKNHLYSWQDAMKSYQANLREIQNLTFDDENNRNMVVSEGNKKYMYSSRNLLGAMDAVEKELFIHNLKNLIKEDSYIS